MNKIARLTAPGLLVVFLLSACAPSGLNMSEQDQPQTEKDILEPATLEALSADRIDGETVRLLGTDSERQFYVATGENKDSVTQACLIAIEEAGAFWSCAAGFPLALETQSFEAKLWQFAPSEKPEGGEWVSSSLWVAAK